MKQPPDGGSGSSGGRVWNNSHVQIGQKDIPKLR